MIIDRIYTFARTRPAHTALIKDGLAVTYAQFARAIERTRMHLEKLGLPERTTAAVLIDDLATCWIVCIALRSLGLDVLTAMTALQIQELNVSNLSCFVMIEGDTGPAKLPQPGMRLVVVPGSMCTDLDSDELPAPIGADARYGGHIVHTSGTTGSRKKLLWPAAMEDRRIARRTQTYGLPDDFVVNNLAFPPLDGHWRLDAHGGMAFGMLCGFRPDEGFRIESVQVRGDPGFPCAGPPAPPFCAGAHCG